MQNHPSLHHPKIDPLVQLATKPVPLSYYATLAKITQQQMQSRANARLKLSA